MQINLVGKKIIYEARYKLFWSKRKHARTRWNSMSKAKQQPRHRSLNSIGIALAFSGGVRLKNVGWISFARGERIHYRFGDEPVRTNARKCSPWKRGLQPGVVTAMPAGAVVLTCSQRRNLIRRHKASSDKSGATEHLGKKTTSYSNPNLLSAPPHRTDDRPSHFPRWLLALAAHGEAPHVLPQEPQGRQGKVQHGLFSQEGAHPGLVDVEERRIVPNGQGSLARSALQREELHAAVEVGVAGGRGCLRAHSGVENLHRGKRSQVLQNHLPGRWGGG